MSNALKVREFYAPAHFGNTFEVAMQPEMMERLTEAKEWGFNRYSDWFDTADILNPYSGPSRFNLAQAMWQRKFEHYADAARLGFELGLCISPNHVFLDQVTPATAARLDSQDKRIFGQLVCPCKPGVTDMILDFYRRLFHDFADRGLSLKCVFFGAYDYGGCACETCRPWIITFGKLSRRIAALARDVFGPLETAVSGWYFSDDDYRQFAEWADHEAQDFCDAMIFQAPLGITTEGAWFKSMPRHSRARAFIHTPNGEKQNHDIYGHFGPNLAPERMEQTMTTLFQHQCDGLTAYSEGDMDEVNRAIVAGMGSGKFRNADEVLAAYAERHLGGDLSGWAAWLRGMGDIDAVDAKAARRIFDRLAATARPSWRLQALEAKLKMLEADRKVRAAKPGSAECEQAKRDFWHTKACLWRDAWKLGLGREIFKFDVAWAVPDWAVKKT